MPSAQKRAIEKYRERLSERGMARFEVIARETDRDLIRSLARELAQEGPDAERLRSQVAAQLTGDAPVKGGILAALRRSPLVGADLHLGRVRTTGRKIAL